MFRNLLYQTYLLISCSLLFILLGWLALFNKTMARLICRLWAKNCTIGAKYILGINYKITGSPLSKPAIYACKHQAAWETAFLQTIIKNPVFILKKELIQLPIFGNFIRMAGHIAIDRSHGAKMLKPMVEAVTQAIIAHNNVIIFPEGTRTLPGEKVRYKQGIAVLYENLPDVEIIPISLNSGLLWPKRGFVKKRGVIEITFRSPVAKNLGRQEFMNVLKDQIESLN